MFTNLVNEFNSKCPKRRSSDQGAARYTELLHINPSPLLKSLVNGVWSTDPALQLEATAYCRQLLSIEHCPSIDAIINSVINSGVVFKFVSFLGRHEMPKLQFEVALTNVAFETFEHPKAVIMDNVPLLSSGSSDLKEKAVLALGIIASDSASCRDCVLAHGALMPLIGMLTKESSLFMLRKATWTLSNFCHGTPFVKAFYKSI